MDMTEVKILPPARVLDVTGGDLPSDAPPEIKAGVAAVRAYLATLSGEEEEETVKDAIEAIMLTHGAKGHAVVRKELVSGHSHFELTDEIKDALDQSYAEIKALIETHPEARAKGLSFSEWYDDETKAAVMRMSKRLLIAAGGDKKLAKRLAEMVAMRIMAETVMGDDPFGFDE